MAFVQSSQMLGVQWFYARRERWEPFGEVENVELEDAEHVGRDRVEFGTGRLPAVLSERIQHNYDAGSKRAILRGTWFFQRSNGTMCPYPEDVAAALELAFPAKSSVLTSAKSRTVTTVAVDSARSVYQAMEEGEFAQVHAGTHKVCTSLDMCTCMHGELDTCAKHTRAHVCIELDHLSAAKQSGRPISANASVLHTHNRSRTRHTHTKVRWVTVVYKEGALPMKTVTPLSEEQQQKNEQRVLTRSSSDLHRTHLVEQEIEKTADEVGVFRLTQWWCQRKDVWHHYSDDDNLNLENAYYPPRNVQVFACLRLFIVPNHFHHWTKVDLKINPCTRTHTSTNLHAGIKI